MFIPAKQEPYMTRPALTLLVLLVLTAPAIGAQPPGAPVPVGARVRVAAPPRVEWTTGIVAAADSARVVVRAAPGATADTFLLASVSALEVSRGRRRLVRGAVGLLIGAAVGGGIGAAVGARGSSADAGFASYILGVGGAAAGAVLGVTLGALSAPERWEPVWLGPR